MDSQKIGGREAVWFFVILFVSKILFADINRYVNTSATAAYMQTAWCGALALVIFFITVIIAGNNKDIFDVSEAVFGKTGLKCTGLAISALLLADAGVMLRVYADIISSIALPDSADIFIVILLVIAAVFAAFSGIGTLVAYCYGAGIILVGSLALILILNAPNYDFANVYPVFGNGVKSIVFGLGGLDVYADIFLIFLMAPYLKKDTSTVKTGIKAIAISAVVITFTTFLYILTVPYPASKEFALPVLEIAFDVNLDVVFQRAEGLFLFLWIFSGFILMGAYLCFAIQSFQKAFNIKDRRAVIGIFVFLAACIALSAETASLYDRVYSIFYTVFTTIAFALPVVVFGAKRIRRKYEKS